VAAVSAGPIATAGRGDVIPYRGLMGFNPFGKRAQRRSDLFILLLAFVIVAALVIWAAFPR
jgi:hypothetical protein